MPLTRKGKKIMSSMQATYQDDPDPDKAQQVFYASRNAGTITGVDPESSGKRPLPSRKKKKGE